MTYYPALAVRTDFSLGESVLTVDELPAIAKDLGTSIVGVTDTMSVSSVIMASKALKKEGIKLLPGVRVRVIETAEKDAKESFIKLYPVDDEGMRSIFSILTRGFEEDRFYYVARVTWDDLIALIADDHLVISTGDTESALQRDESSDGLTRLLSQKRFVRAFYELVPASTPYWSRHNRRSIDFGDRNDIDPLVTMPSLWQIDTAEIFSVNAAIANNRPYLDYLQPATEHHPRKLPDLAAEMKLAVDAIAHRYPMFRKAGSYFRDGLLNTEALANVCNYEWEALPPSLPVLAIDPNQALTDACKAGWKKRFTRAFFGHQPTPADLKADYLPRLQFELETLKRLGFAQYFLLVADLVVWSKDNGIAVGPGRGSVGGSLVAYLMGITDVDPIRFNLLFERFINPDRLDLPDADLDFLSERRHEVIEYLVGKYGADHVAGIVNYNTLGGASSIRDIGRIYGLTGFDMKPTTFIPAVHGVTMELEEAADSVPELAQFRANFADIWSKAIKIGGRLRSFGTHAAGVVVAGEPLVNRAVVERRSGTRVINWDKNTAELQGLIKLDVLGLTTLDVFATALDLIWENHQVRVDLSALPLDDQPTLELFSEARTHGVFQFEGGSVRRLLKQMAETGTLSFDDLVALNALNRPGPLDAGLCDSYIRRRNGIEQISYPDPSVVNVLENTYGVITYQEQVMQVARSLCGFTPGEADKLRKIMGKKLPEEMKKERDHFVDGAVTHGGMDPTKAGSLFDDIEGFAGYAFNKSHSVAYTLIAYQAAWLKAHYTAEFYAAAMTHAKEDKAMTVARAAANDGIELLPPDANISTDRFEIMNATSICAPLSVVKNVSTTAARAVMAARVNPTVIEKTSGRGNSKTTTTTTLGPGRFLNMEDFRARIPSRLLNSKALEHLDRVGAFARIEPGQLPALHESRRRDQIALMPSIADQAVKAEREIATDEAVGDVLCQVIDDMHSAIGDAAVLSEWGRDPRFMVVFDAPFSDHMRFFDTFCWKDYLRDVLQEVGLHPDHAIWTWCARRPKVKGEREVPAAEVQAAIPFLQREVALAKPPVILTMGAGAARTLVPDLKGSMNDHIGKAIYSAELDASIIIGLNPMQLYHDPGKRELLVQVFSQVRDLIEN